MPPKKAKQTDWLIAVGQRFRALMKKRKKAQGELGVSPTTVGSLEKGFGAGLDSIETACRAMGVDPRDVFASFPVQSAVQSEALHTKELAHMLRDPEKNRVLSYLHDMNHDETIEMVSKAQEIWKRRHSSARRAVHDP